MTTSGRRDQDLHPDFSGNYNLSDELGIPSVDNSEPLTMNELPDDEYRHNWYKLWIKNKKNFSIMYCIWLRPLNNHFAVCLVVVQVLVNYMSLKPYIRLHWSITVLDLELIFPTKVLMLAPTGKAAYNIKGNTIHSALAIPASQSLRNCKSLDSSRLNTIRCQLGGIKQSRMRLHGA